MKKKLEFDPNLQKPSFDELGRAWVTANIESNNAAFEKFKPLLTATYADNKPGWQRVVFAMHGVPLAQFLAAQEFADDAIDELLAAIKAEAIRLREPQELTADQRRQLQALSRITGLSPDNLAKLAGVKLKKPPIEIEDRTDPDLD